jgi:hypothetical protein
MRRTTLWLAALPLLAASAAWADEETPEARTARVSAGFPEPSAEQGLAWDLEIRMGGGKSGDMRIEAAPGEREGHLGWRLTAVAQMAGGRAKETSDEFAGRDLVTIEGRKEIGDGTNMRGGTWFRTPEGYEVITGTGTPESETKHTVAAPEGAAGGLAGAFLFCRLLPAEPGVYARKVFDVTDRRGRILLDGTIEVVGDAEWTVGEETRKTWFVRMKRGDSEGWHLHFDRESRDLIVARMEGGGVEIVPAGSPGATKRVDLGEPAATPQAATIKALVGINSRDLPLLDEAFEWSAMLEAGKADGTLASATTVDSLKQAFVSRVRKEMERSQAEAFLGGISAALEVEDLEGGDARVRVPEEFGGLVLTVRAFDGVWKVVRLPSS